MTTESLIPDEARAMIGAESEPVTGYPVSEHEIRRYAYAVDDLNPLWTDPEYARNTRHGGIVAPPLFHIIPFANDRPLSNLREDGIPGGRRWQVVAAVAGHPDHGGGHRRGVLRAHPPW